MEAVDDGRAAGGRPRQGTGALFSGTADARFSPLVEKAKIDALRRSTPHLPPRLGDEAYAQIMGGTVPRLLGLA